MRGGVLEPERLGMERVTRHQGETILDELPVLGERGALEDAVAAVTLVVEQRMTLPRHVDANLVGTARFETAFDERDVVITFQHAPMGHGMLAVGTVLEDVHFLPLARTAAYVARDSPLVLGEIAPHEGDIAAINRVVEKLLGQPCVGLLVLGDDQQSRSVLVDAVDVYKRQSPICNGRESGNPGNGTS